MLGAPPDASAAPPGRLRHPAKPHTRPVNTSTGTRPAGAPPGWPVACSGRPSRCRRARRLRERQRLRCGALWLSGLVPIEGLGQHPPWNHSSPSCNEEVLRHRENPAIRLRDLSERAATTGPLLPPDAEVSIARISGRQALPLERTRKRRRCPCGVPRSHRSRCHARAGGVPPPRHERDRRSNSAGRRRRAPCSSRRAQAGWGPCRGCAAYAGAASQSWPSACSEPWSWIELS